MVERLVKGQNFVVCLYASVLRKKFRWSRLKDCPNHCAPTGWGVWKIGNCAVTCGKGVLIRVRVCRDQLKTELAEKSDCIKKVGNDKKQRQTEACDMGPCPGVSKVEVFREGLKKCLRNI